MADEFHDQDLEDVESCERHVKYWEEKVNEYMFSDEEGPELYLEILDLMQKHLEISREWYKRQHGNYPNTQNT